MNPLIEKIKEKHKLSENEKTMIEYIVEHLDEIPKISSRELARRTYTTSTAVIRLVKKLDFENYNDFKLNIASYLKNIQPSSLEIGSKEDVLMLVNKMSGIEVNAIYQTKEMLSMETLKETINLLLKYQYIDIIATDTNACIGEYAKHLFWGLGKIVNVYQNEDVQLLFSLHVPEDHVVIIISRYGQSACTHQVVKTLLEKNVPIIALTTKRPNLLNEQGTYVFYGCDGNAIGRLSGLVFSISIKYLFDLFSVILYSKNHEERLKVEELILQYYQDL